MHTFPICRSHQKEGTVSTLEGRSVIKKQLCRLEEWAEKTPMRTPSSAPGCPERLCYLHPWRSPGCKTNQTSNQTHAVSTRMLTRTLDTITMNFPVHTCQRTPPVHSSLFYNGALFHNTRKQKPTNQPNTHHTKQNTVNDSMLQRTRNSSLTWISFFPPYTNVFCQPVTTS